MLLCDSKRIGFVQIPKTGTTSVRKALQPIIDTQIATRHSTLPLRVRRQFPGTHFFAVVRNPWERHVSFYRRHSMYQAPYKGWTFQDWLDRMGKLAPEKWKDQMHYIFDKRLVVDTLLRFENLNEEFYRFCKTRRLKGLTMPVKKLNATGDYDYRTYYDAESLEQIAPYVQRDAEQFGYGFGD